MKKSERAETVRNLLLKAKTKKKPLHGRGFFLRLSKIKLKFYSVTFTSMEMNASDP